MRKPGPPELPISRLEFLQRAGLGFGCLGLNSLLSEGQVTNKSEVGEPHFRPRVKSVIFLFMYGGVSHVDTFDYKPALEKYKDKQISTLKINNLGEARTKNGKLLPSVYPMRQHGESGMWVCDQYPHLAQVVDKLTFVKSVYGESTNHGPALLEMNTGMTRVGFPSVGSWVTYGLGSPNKDMPGFVVMYDHRGGPINGPQNWGGGFLSAAYQATPVRSRGVPILDLARPEDVDDEQQRGQLDLMRALNSRHADARPAETDLMARIQSFELAYRMQTEAPRVMDLTGETDETKRLYGIEPGKRTAYFGAQCLLARRMVERGVRFVQIYSGGAHGDNNWDAHGSVTRNHTKHIYDTDQPMAGLILDLERRGLLDETLIVWGSEFGRTPHQQGGGDGRDHHPYGMTMFFAGGGMRPGMSYGETDEVGYHAAVNPVSVHDVHATILHQLGLDHKRLTFAHRGRDFRLTDVSGDPIWKILA
jgi:hypothetical protein